MSSITFDILSEQCKEGKRKCTKCGRYNIDVLKESELEMDNEGIKIKIPKECNQCKMIEDL